MLLGWRSQCCILFQGKWNQSHLRPFGLPERKAKYCPDQRERKKQCYVGSDINHSDRNDGCLINSCFLLRITALWYLEKYCPFLHKTRTPRQKPKDDKDTYDKGVTSTSFLQTTDKMIKVLISDFKCQVSERIQGIS